MDLPAGNEERSIKSSPGKTPGARAKPVAWVRELCFPDPIFLSEYPGGYHVPISIGSILRGLHTVTSMVGVWFGVKKVLERYYAWSKWNHLPSKPVASRMWNLRYDTPTSLKVKSDRLMTGPLL